MYEARVAERAGGADADARAAELRKLEDARRVAEKRRARHQKTLEEATEHLRFVDDLATTLEADADRWASEEAAAAADLARARADGERLAGLLEAKLADAMRRLDEPPPPP